MEKSIQFPKLGLQFKEVGTGISVLGIEISYYGILMGISILLGVLLVLWEAKRTRQKVEDYFDYAIVAIALGILGARLYYIIFSMGYYKDHLLDLFNIRSGGFAIYGGILAAIAGIVVMANRKNANVYRVLDTAVYGLALAQIIGRWGNFFNRESFGDYTNGLFAMRLPVKAVRISDITEKMGEHAIVVDGVSYIQAHPLFLYESLWCLVLFVGILVYRKNRKFHGQIFFLYTIGYGIGRIIFEAMRTDKLTFFRIPVSMVVALVSIGVSVWFLSSLGRKNRRRRRRRRPAQRSR